MQHHPRRGSTPTPQRVRDVLKPISGAAVGNMLEWFDYSLYGYPTAWVDDPSPLRRHWHTSSLRFLCSGSSWARHQRW